MAAVSLRWVQNSSVVISAMVARTVSAGPRKRFLAGVKKTRPCQTISSPTSNSTR